MDTTVTVKIEMEIEISKNTINKLIVNAISEISAEWGLFILPSNWKENYGSIDNICFMNYDTIVFDVKTGDKLGVINLSTTAYALQLMADGQGVSKDHIDSIFSGDWDAETADVFMQMAVMGEIVYG